MCWREPPTSFRLTVLLTEIFSGSTLFSMQQAPEHAPCEYSEPRLIDGNRGEGTCCAPCSQPRPLESHRMSPLVRERTTEGKYSQIMTFSDSSNQTYYHQGALSAKDLTTRQASKTRGDTCRFACVVDERLN